MLDQNKKFFSNQKIFKKPTITQIPFTKQEFDRIHQERRELMAQRKEVMIRLQTAREMGDLSENGAYQYAKFELGDIGRKLRKLNHLIENGYVQEKSQSNTIGFGSIVTLVNQDQKVTYTLVSEHESNPREKKLSLKSPIGQALVEKKKGDQVTISTPRGEVKYIIDQIE